MIRPAIPQHGNAMEDRIQQPLSEEAMEAQEKAKAAINPRLRLPAILVALIWACFVALDVIAYLNGSRSSVTMYLKGIASFSCASIAFYSWILNKKTVKDLLRWLGFFLAFLGDVAVLLNTYRIYSDARVFAIGGYLFIPALLLIAASNADFFSYLRVGGKMNKKGILFGLYFYIPFAVLLVLLGKSLKEVGLLGLGIGYGLCLVTVLWTGWAALKNGIYAKGKGVLLATGATLVFVMELIGLVYNLHIKGIEDIAFFATWILYVPGMLLMAIA
jgi:hypothetical protein